MERQELSKEFPKGQMKTYLFTTSSFSKNKTALFKTPKKEVQDQKKKKITSPIKKHTHVIHCLQVQGIKKKKSKAIHFCHV